jgi:hypothetical protein
VEPRGFEPLTSAVQKRIHTVVVVRCCSEIPANKPIISRRLSYVFAVVRLGCCTVAAHKLAFDRANIWVRFNAHPEGDGAKLQLFSPLRGSVNRRVAYVSRHDGKAIESL